jgi:CCR4-NOT transcription complex subunit 3
VPPASAPAPAPAPPPPKPEPVATTTLQQDHITAVTSSPSLTQISTSSPFMSSTSASAQQPDGSFGSPLVSEAESHPEPAASASAPSPLGAGESLFVRWLPVLPSSGTRVNNRGRAGVHEPPQEVPLPVRQLHVLGSRTIIDRGQQSAAPPSADGQAGSAWHAPAPVMTATSTSVPEAVRSPPPVQPQQQQQPALASSPLPPTTQTQAQLPQFPPGMKLDVQRPPSALPQQQQPQQQQPVQRNAFPGSLSDLVASFETVKQKGERFSHR